VVLHAAAPPVATGAARAAAKISPSALPGLKPGVYSVCLPQAGVILSGASDPSGWDLVPSKYQGK
jgi:hypothetical protein